MENLELLFSKNTAESTQSVLIIDKDIIFIKTENDTGKNIEFKKDINQNFIQIHFNINGLSEFLFNEGHYKIPLNNERMLLLYNPQKALPLHQVTAPKSQIISLLISIHKFHSLFSSEAGHIDFLSLENKDKKYYNEDKISPAMMVVLHQMLHANFQKNLQPLYMKAKVYELLALYFNRSNEADIEQCPFLADEESISKIHKAKEIVISRIAEPPSLQELANEIGLNIKKLKEGFKQIYGDSVYAFLFDYKMEVARKMLESKDMNINEVSIKVGYSTPSHFIAAFKKKYGITPKKYIRNIN
ncbi:helix-turn-helix domain-containing protein [Capnocytophaga felis]|uniref:AraC family transcriptional regulator n=1 Tax=Capnocytophaga felis TaxID=2267611 RepID=A0A5M4B5P5_9FLAO|nr:AraC family transcriptional regulator [Capnocytophaga felis]GET44914.1 AraC family transcriptional regulator [Capnocytophaga felis]GET49366.1 AraC family transcriptional regulator [Capnocytophaga felis]